MYLFRGDAPLQEFGATLPPPVRLGFRLVGTPLPAQPTPTRRPSSSPSPASSAPRCHDADHPARRHHRARHHRGGAGRGLRVRRHGPCPAARAGPAQPHAGRQRHVVALHPLQQVHADDLLGHALRPGDRPVRVGPPPVLPRPRPAAGGPPTAPPPRAGRPATAASPRRRSGRRTARRSGSPASFQCSGSEMAGWPVTLNGGVNGT